jgi:hypothetical protein
MKRFPPLRLAILLTPLLPVAACAPGPDHVAEHLNERLQFQLAPQMTASQAALEEFPDGARVTLTDQSLFKPGSAELSDSGHYIIASVIEGLVNPSLLRIELAESPASSPYLRDQRLQTVTTFLSDYQLLPSLHPGTWQDTTPPPANGAPPSQVLAITITVAPKPPG